MDLPVNPPVLPMLAKRVAQLPSGDDWIYEPNWESGKAQRWVIYQDGGVPMGIAGIYRKWRHPDGSEHFTFAYISDSTSGSVIFWVAMGMCAASILATGDAALAERLARWRQAQTDAVAEHPADHDAG